ncbi:MAG TPA: tetratricopeptide repeat protein [Polyangiaceae bacterium]
MTRLTLALAASLATVLAASTGSADDPRRADLAAAETLFHQGSTLVNAGRYAEACPKLEAARRLVRGIGVTLYLGECYERTGRLVAAWEQFDEARAMAEAQHDRRADVARDRAQQLWSRLPRLTVVVASSAPGLQVTDDGVPLDPATYNVERAVAPGIHHLRAEAPGRPAWEAPVSVPSAPGTVRVEIPAPEEPPSPTTPAPLANVLAPSPATDSAAMVAPPELRTAGPTPQRIVGIALLGAGAVGLATGTLFGLEAKARQDASNSGGHCLPNDHCDATGLHDRSTALTDATISTVGLVAGLACAGGGAVLYLTAPDDRPARVALTARPRYGGGSVVLEGRW